MNIKTSALTALLLCGVSAGAMAAPILTGSTINFAGQSTCNSTTCTFGSAVVTSGTGSFNTFTFGTAATFAPLVYSPFTAQQVYTSTAGALTTTFSVTSQLAQSTTTLGGLTNYNITDIGFATLTGFDSTPGTFTFTANQNGTIQGSFSATTTASAVPEPLSISLLGAGLVGMGAVRFRRNKA